MSFVSVRTLNSSRFAEVQTFFNLIRSLEPIDSTQTIPIEVQIMKGHFYVHTYAAVESVFNELVKQIILLIGAKGIQNVHYSIMFNTVAVADELQAYRQCSSKKRIENVVSLFQTISSTNTRLLNESMFSMQLQNVSTKTIEEVVLAFGMDTLILTGQEKFTLNEFVEKRNSVAHGREMANTVGQTHRTAVLLTKLQLIQNLLDKVIDHFEQFFLQKKFLMPAARSLYL